MLNLVEVKNVVRHFDLRLHDRIRTCNPLIRSQILYPLSYMELYRPSIAWPIGLLQAIDKTLPSVGLETDDWSLTLCLSVPNFDFNAYVSAFYATSTRITARTFRPTCFYTVTRLATRTLCPTSFHAIYINTPGAFIPTCFHAVGSTTFCALGPIPCQG